jgi:hypothetical protein
MKRHNSTMSSNNFFPCESLHNIEQPCNLNKFGTNLKTKLELLLKNILFNDKKQLSKNELKYFDSRERFNKFEKKKRLKTMHSSRFNENDADDEKERLSLMLNIDLKNNHLNILDLSKDKNKFYKMCAYANNLSTSIPDIQNEISSFSNDSSSSDSLSKSIFSSKTPMYRDRINRDKELTNPETEKKINTARITPKLKRKFSTLASRSKSSNCSFQIDEKFDYSSQKPHTSINKKPISLVYYHHLYNERNKEFSSENSLQPLYKKMFNKLKNSYSFEKQEECDYKQKQYKSHKNEPTHQAPRSILKNKLNHQNACLNEKSHWSEIAAELQLNDQELLMEQTQMDVKRKPCSKRMKQIGLSKEYTQGIKNKSPGTNYSNNSNSQKELRQNSKSKNSLSD